MLANEKPMLFQILVSKDVSTSAPFFYHISTSLLLVVVRVHSTGFVHYVDKT